MRHISLLSGFALLGVVYYWGAEAYLIDPEVADIGQFEAILLSIGFLGIWLDSLRHPLSHSDADQNDLFLAAAVFFFNIAGIYWHNKCLQRNGCLRSCRRCRRNYHGGKCFFYHYSKPENCCGRPHRWADTGSKIRAGGKQRSTHNNYLTLPVLLMMISTHFPMIFGHEQSWVVVALILIVGGVILWDFFNRKNAGRTGRAFEMAMAHFCSIHGCPCFIHKL